MPRTIRWDPPRSPFALAHVAPLGVTRSALRTAVRSGRVLRLAQGVFVAADVVGEAGQRPDPVRWHLLTAQAVQLRQPTLIASHHTAALAWGLALDDPRAAAAGRASFISPPRDGVRSVREAGFTAAVRRLPAGHRVAHPSGLNVTSRARTALDVAATAGVPEALIVLDSAARQELVEAVGGGGVRRRQYDGRALAAARDPLWAALPAAATRRTRSHLESVVDLVDPRRESALESLSYGQMIRHELPLPALQVRIRAEIGDLYPDFLWAGARVIGEADGLLKYQEPDDLRREKLRQEALESLGYVVLRWTDREIRRSPAAVMARIRAALEARS